MSSIVGNFELAIVCVDVRSCVDRAFQCPQGYQHCL
jgi:hypothetical protein